MAFSTLFYVLWLSSVGIALISLPTDSQRLIYAGTDIEQIQERALTLYDTVDTSNSRGSAVFPDLRFTCSGDITSIWFIATESNADIDEDEAVYPEFRVWRRSRIVPVGSTQFTRYLGAVRDSRTPSSSGAGIHVNTTGDDLSLYEYRLEVPMHFEEGDVLGMSQTQFSPLIVRYLDGGGVRTYAFVGRFQSYIYAPDNGWDLEPLLALEVTGGNSSCFEGFLSVDALKLYVEASTNISNDEIVPEAADIPPTPLSYVFPSLQFSEGGLLEKWVFGADLVSSSLQPQPISIDFQVWRNADDRVAVFSTNITSPPTRSGHLNVYEYTVNPPQPVQAGDYVGIMVDLPSYLRPQWVPGIGTQYFEVLRSASREVSVSFNDSGIATPLFAAQVRVMASLEPSIGSSGVSQSTTLVASSIESTASILALSTVTAMTSGTLNTAPLSSLPTATPLQATSTIITQSTIQSTSLAPSTIQTTSVLLESSTVPGGSTPINNLSATRGLNSNIPINSDINIPQPTSTDALHVPTSPASSSLPPSTSDGDTGSIMTPVVIVIIIVIILLSGATIALCVFLICVRRKRKIANKSSQGHTQTEEGKSRAGFFDNPVYDHLQRTLSRKDSHGYSSITDHVYLEVPEGILSHTKTTGDGDSGYAELEEKTATLTVNRVSYAPLVGSPSPCASPYPSPRPSPHLTPCHSPPLCASPTPHPTQPTAAPRKFHQYHSAEKCQLPEDYLDPRPSVTPSGSSDTLLRSATCRDVTPTPCRSDHEYQELDPSSGGYHRLHTMSGIHVPTQAQRRASEDKDNTYETIGERLYSDITELSFFEDKATYWRPASTTDALYSQLASNKYREILHSQIKVGHVLGSGNFGEVNKGVWQSGDQRSVEVAVKTLKSGTSEEDTVRFLQEAAIMGQFRHPNILQLHGVVTLAEHTMIILEYLAHGDLGTFLVNKRPLSGSTVPQDTPSLLLGFCRDVASGMEYLQRKAFVHRDLAARNILVEQNHCKIGDFGLSRDLLNENYYISRGGVIPLKWTAPEALHYRKYSTASDVWSFGCLMYEIWSLGHKPFDNHTPDEVQKLIENGERLAPPPGCPRGVYSLMMECWHPDHDSRPSFLHLLKLLASSSSQLLSWSHEDTWGVPDAIVLGAPLHAGEKLYPDLQDTYTCSQV